MGVRSAVTAIPVLSGPVPGVTATVSSVDSPASSDAGLAAPTPDGLVVTALTVSEMVVAPERPSASAMPTGRDNAPGDEPAPTVASYENVLSPAVTSPIEPSSKKA